MICTLSKCLGKYQYNSLFCAVPVKIIYFLINSQDIFRQFFLNTAFNVVITTKILIILGNCIIVYCKLYRLIVNDY